MSRPGRRYRPQRPRVWFCIECARAGRRNIYTDNSKKTCPFGHHRKARP